jgi:hypothetical protein
MESGAFTGDGSARQVRTLAFRPRRVVLHNVGGLVSAEWNETMADASMVKRVTDGTMTFPTTNGITPLSNGFTVGADADLNAAGELVHWVAFE